MCSARDPTERPISWISGSRYSFPVPARHLTGRRLIRGPGADPGTTRAAQLRAAFTLCNLFRSFRKYRTAGGLQVSVAIGLKEDIMRLRFVTLLAGTVALGLGTAGLSGQERAPYSAIVVFGTSLSDSGNAFALRGGTNTPPDYMLDPLLIPAAPYARGGHHFSNGATWVEQFARSVRLAGTFGRRLDRTA